MSKGGGKGRISNKLVAASCAAILTVYAAGYWRTRDAARQFEAQSKARRPAARARAAAASGLKPGALALSLAAPQPRPEPTGTTPPGVAAATAPRVATTETAPASSPATRRSPRPPAPKPTSAPASRSASARLATAARPSKAEGAPQTGAAPGSPAAGIVVAAIPMPSELPPAPKMPLGPPATPAARWRDGTYTGHGDSPHGDMDIRVVIKDGRILEAPIETCNTRYSCEILDPMVQQSVVIQSSDVDYISRATDSSEAYFDALVDALKQALYPQSEKEAAPP